MARPPATNPNVPSVDRPLADLMALAQVTEQLRQGVQSLGGQRGLSSDRAVTFNDLDTMGLTGMADRMTSLEQRTASLEARMTAVEEFIASLPPPP